MKVFSCGGIIPGCPEVFRGVDEGALLAAVADHAARDHGLAEVPAPVLVLVREQIRDVDDP